MIQPRPITFWRFILGVILFLCLFTYLDFYNITQQFAIVLSTSRTWMGLFGLLTLFAIFVLALLVLAYAERGRRLVNSLEALISKNEGHQILGGLLLAIGLAGFALFTSIPYFVKVFGGQPAARYLMFLLFGLIGTFGIRLLGRNIPWMTAFLSMVLFQSLIQLFLVFSTAVTAYPFAMGWSETSRYYFPSLFLSRLVYGQEVPWPVLHPTLHLLLAPPYLFDAPLWFHRLWQVALRFLLIGLVVPPLLGRLSISSRLLRWFVGLWMFLFLFMGPTVFSSGSAGHHHAGRLFTSERKTDLDCPGPGFHLVRLEPRELVPGAGHDRGGPVPAGAAFERQKSMALSFAAVSLVRRGNSRRLPFAEDLYPAFRPRSGKLLHQPFLRPALVQASSQCNVFPGTCACSSPGLPADVAGDGPCAPLESAGTMESGPAAPDRRRAAGVVPRWAAGEPENWWRRGHP